jgi:prepilin peptidase CpaA
MIISDELIIELRSWMLVAVVLWIAIHDLRHYRITNLSVIVTLLAGIGWSLALGHLSGLGQSLSGIAVGFLLLIVFYSVGGVTAGDVKWMAALGAWYGPKGVVGVFLVSGGILGLLSLGWTFYAAINPVERDSLELKSTPQQTGVEKIDQVYESKDRRRRMIPYALPVGLAVVLIEFSRALLRDT